MTTDPNASPFNRLPWPVVVWALAILGVEAALTAGAMGLVGGADAIGWRLRAFEDFAFSAPVQHWMLDTGRAPWDDLARYVTFAFVHGGFPHAILTTAVIAALGKSVAETMGTRAFLVLALVVPALSAALFGLIVGNDQQAWLFGAMVPAFALVGAFTWTKWAEAAGDRARQRRAFSLIALLLGARLAFGLMADIGPGWMAEVIAFALGFALAATVLAPGQWARLRARMRQRG